MTSTIEVERLLRSTNWEVRDVVAVLAISTYHVHERQGVEDDRNPFTGIVDWKMDGLRVSGPAKRLRRDTVPQANRFVDPYTRIAVVARAFRQEPDWKPEWKQVAPVAFILWFFGEANLPDESFVRISHLLDSDMPVEELADRIASLVVAVPDTPGHLTA